MKFYVGDEVSVNPDHLKDCCSPNCRCWVRDSNDFPQYQGRKAIITFKSQDMGFYYVDIDGAGHAWSDCMLVELLDKQMQKVLSAAMLF